MKVINLYGPPGCGKSTTMEGLTYEMKLLGLSVECTPEVFKELILEEAEKTKHGGQLTILAKQNARLVRLDGKNDFTITDCPLPLIGYYTPQDYITGFHDTINSLYNHYDNVNYFIIRKHEFENEKRSHDEEQSLRIEKEIPVFLDKYGIPFKTLESTVPSGERLVNRILTDLIETNVITLDHLSKSRSAEVRAKYKR